MLNIKREKNISKKDKKLAIKLKEIRDAVDDPDEKLADYQQLSPVEQLSMDIAVHLAYVTAKRLGEIMDDVSYDAVGQLFIHMDNYESEIAVSMIQAFFLTYGLTHAAEDLDILIECELYYCEIYNAFIDELYDADSLVWDYVEVLCSENDLSKIE